MPLVVVIGPPCAGKTTWVAEHAVARDIVIDFDVLAVALAGPGAHSHRHHRVLKQVAWAARRAALREALKHTGSTTVYLVHTHPNAADLAAYRREGATIVIVDPGRELVLRRCRELRPPGHLAAAHRWYAAHDRGAFAEATPVQPRTSRRW